MKERLEDELERLGERPDELADVYQNMARCMSEVWSTWSTHCKEGTKGALRGGTVPRMAKNGKLLRPSPSSPKRKIILNLQRIPHLGKLQGKCMSKAMHQI